MIIKALSHPDYLPSLTRLQFSTDDHLDSDGGYEPEEESFVVESELHSYESELMNVLRMRENPFELIRLPVLNDVCVTKLRESVPKVYVRAIF